MMTRLLSALPLLVLGGCTVPSDTSPIAREAGPVAAARSDLMGLNQTDIRMCAGFPTRTYDNGPDTIWTYQREARRGGVYVSLPSLTGGPFRGTAGSVTTTSAGICKAQFRFHDGKVAQVEFAGDNNGLNRINQLCVPVVDGCVRYAQAGRHAPAPQPEETE